MLAQPVAPFTSEHSARGVVYNMTFGPPITAPQDGYGMAVADLDGDDDLDAADAALFWARASFARGAVDASDLATMLGAWGSAGSPADLDLDGTVGAGDLSVLLGAWSGG